MENQAPKRREGDDVVSGSDRISHLPESVLLHILCFLSQKKAVQTCLLSKSWRHLGSTRPVIDLRGICRSHHLHVRPINGVCENCFEGNKEAFLSVLENTFQRYHHLNLFTQELNLEMLDVASAISVLEKWIPIVFIKSKAYVNAFRLSFIGGGVFFNLPSVVFKAESLQELCLNWCSLNEISLIDDLLLKNLQKLSFSNVDISDETLGKILSGCPMVKYVVLYHCKGFKTINMANKNRHLNYFEFSGNLYDKIEHYIEIDAPTLQSIHIVCCSYWCHNHNNYFTHLKSLFLCQVKLSTESIHNFSCNFPCLEELTLSNCSGFEEINLSSRSIKRLSIHSWSSIKKVAIEVPNILYFEFSTIFNLPTTLSLTTTSRKWKSRLHLYHCLDVHDDDNLPRVFTFIEMVKALSQSQISVSISEKLFKINQIEWDFNDNPVVVEHLSLGILRPHSHTQFLNALFRIFRPRYINAVPACDIYDEKATQLFLWKTLIHEREKTEYGWEQHLEEVSIEAFLEQHLEEVSIEASDEKGKIWHHVKRTSLPEWSKNQKILFRLKWRD